MKTLTIKCQVQNLQRENDNSFIVKCNVKYDNKPNYCHFNQPKKSGGHTLKEQLY